MFLKEKFLKKLPIVIFLVLFFVPFFWFPKNAVDLGGDGNRLYFYDPLAFTNNVSIFGITPEGKALVNPSNHAYLFYVLFIAGIKQIVGSPSTVINIFNGFKLSIGFLSIYLIVKELIQAGKSNKRIFFYVDLPSILAGFFYTIATGNEKLIVYWVKALHSHDQVFLNPLIFLLLLRYLLTQNRWYMVCVLFVSLLFSANFAMISAPPFFAFYPIALLFLFLYVIVIRKVKIRIREVVIGLFFFLGLHAFHLIPELLAVFQNNTVATSVVFKESGVNYFTAIRGLGLAVVGIFVPSPATSLQWASFIAPFVLIMGFFQSWKKNKEIGLLCVFFFTTFFLVTANITHVGIELYKKLFLIPGFSMFRNFYLQWGYIFLFFYALLFGESLALVFKKIKVKYIAFAALSVVFLFIIGYWPFLSGRSVDGIHWGSKGVKTAMIMDPRYEQTLAFIKKLPDEGKIVAFPLTDNYIQVVFGMNNAAYSGPSTLPFLTGKKSFAGYQNFWPDPIPEHIMKFSKEKNYTALLQLFSLFNIGYLFHNTDPKIYEEMFPNFPNSYMMTSMPKTQEEYKEFVKHLPVRQIYENGPFQMFEFEERVYRPEVYIPDSIYQTDMLERIEDKSVSFRSAFIEPAQCSQSKIIADFCNARYVSPNLNVSMTKLDPTRYMIRVKQSGSAAPFLLVFQNSFHTGWKLSIDERSPLGEDQHVLVNKYANAWIITEADRNGKTEYTVSLNLETQKYFIYGLWITGFSLVIFVGYAVKTALEKEKL